MVEAFSMSSVPLQHSREISQGCCHRYPSAFPHALRSWLIAGLFWGEPFLVGPQNRLSVYWGNKPQGKLERVPAWIKYEYLSVTLPTSGVCWKKGFNCFQMSCFCCWFIRMVVEGEGVVCGLLELFITFWDRASCNSSCPWTSYVTEDDLEYLMFLQPLPELLGL